VPDEPLCCSQNGIRCLSMLLVKGRRKADVSCGGSSTSAFPFTQYHKYRLSAEKCLWEYCSWAILILNLAGKHAKAQNSHLSDSLHHSDKQPLLAVCSKLDLSITD
jgi:hypothetical protein